MVRVTQSVMRLPQKTFFQEHEGQDDPIAIGSLRTQSVDRENNDFVLFVYAFVFFVLLFNF
jgi:hypothetical protein